MPGRESESRQRPFFATNFAECLHGHCGSQQTQKSQFLVMIAKNFPVARRAYGRIELVLLTPAPQALRGPNTAQARPASKVRRQGVPALPVRCPGGQSRGRYPSGRRRKIERISSPMAEIVNINFQNRNERRWRLSCAYQLTAEAFQASAGSGLESEGSPHERRSRPFPPDRNRVPRPGFTWAGYAPDWRNRPERRKLQAERDFCSVILCRSRRLPAVEGAMVSNDMEFAL